MDVNDDALDQFKFDRANGLGAFTKAASSGTINFEINLVSTILNKACKKWEWLPRTLQLERVDGPRKQPYPLTWEEQDALFSELPKHWSDGLALFGFNTGLRIQELLGLKWADRKKIPTLNTFIFVLHQTKNREAQVVICNSLARLAVERQEGNGSEYVFPSRCNQNKGGRMKNVEAWWEAWERAGLPADKWTRRGPHNMRHTFGHRLREAGVSDEDRAALLHHGTSLEQDYAMPDIERLSECAELATKRREGGVILRRVVG